MTNDMCGIEPGILRSVPPLQGWNGFMGTGSQGDASQGDALGYRVNAPLARWKIGANGTKSASSQGGTLDRRGAVPLAHLPPVSRPSSAPTAHPLYSPGHRPGNAPVNQSPSPERAKPGCARAQARDPEQTIAGNRAEILEVG